MKRKKHAPEDRVASDDPQEIAQRAAERGVPEDVLQGPPALETIGVPGREHPLATPDQDVTDAVGVPRAPEEEFRASSEILDGRDQHRWEAEDSEPSED